MDASNITENNITTKIADGSISPHDRHHYEMALISIQKRGIKGKELNNRFLREIGMASNPNGIQDTCTQINSTFS